MQLKPQISREGMRRLCALFLLLLSVGPWLLALSPFTPTAEALLPTCCRTHGKHKCLMRLAGERSTPSTPDGPAVSRVSERCPYNPACTTTPHSGPFVELAKDVSPIALDPAPSLVVIPIQPSTSFSSCANSKRGPPSPALSLRINDR
jgi:hypothetical protein